MRKNETTAPGEDEAVPDKNFVASLEKGLAVLTCFGRQHSRLNVSEVARLTRSTPASARRSLLTLRALGYLDSDGKRFWLLPKALLVAHAYLASRPEPSVAQPLLDALSERTRESASLALLQDDDAIIIARSTARRSLSTGLGIGSRLPAYCAALGPRLIHILVGIRGRGPPLSGTLAVALRRQPRAQAEDGEDGGGGRPGGRAPDQQPRGSRRAPSPTRPRCWPSSRAAGARATPATTANSNSACAPWPCRCATARSRWWPR